MCKIATKDDFMNAFVNDSLDMIGTFVPLPKELLKFAFNRMKKNPINNYLDVNRERIHQFYNNERLNQLKFQFNGEMEVLPQHIVIDNTKDNLDMTHFIFEFQEDVFELTHEIKDLTSEAFSILKKNLTTSNDENLRLSKLEFKEGIYTFYTQPVYYDAYLHSNMLLDYQISKGFTLRQELHRDGQLESIEDSKLANHLGANILLITPGGKLILPQRSKAVSYAPLELSASVSGAVQSHDAPEGKPLNRLAIFREGIEELGLQRTDIINDSVVFLGLTRELIRGGKPEMFFTMKTNLTEKEINERWLTAKDKWENKTLNCFSFGPMINQPIDTEEGRVTFQEQVDELFNKFGRNMSLPLLTNLALWIEFKMNGH